MTDLITRARTMLAITPDRWRALAQAADADLFRRRPAPGEWSAFDCLGHLLDTEDHVFPLRVRCFLAGEDFPGFDPDAEGTAPADEIDARAMVDRLARAREASVALLAGLGEADLTRTATHAQLGLVTLEELLDHWVGHDLMHTVQAERALMQPFLAASGPWRSYFTDHDVDAIREG